MTLLIVAAVVLFLALMVLVLALCRSAAIGDRDLPHPPERPDADWQWPVDNVREFPRRDHLGGAA